MRVLCFNKCVVYLTHSPIRRKQFNVSFEYSVALLYLVYTILRLDLVCIEGPEGRTKSIWYQYALADGGAAQLGGTKVLDPVDEGI